MIPENGGEAGLDGMTGIACRTPASRGVEHDGGDGNGLSDGLIEHMGYRS